MLAKLSALLQFWCYMMSDAAPQDEVAECAKAISEATGMCFLAGVGTHISNKRKAYHVHVHMVVVQSSLNTMEHTLSKMELC
jgi:hypothetical protein